MIRTTVRWSFGKRRPIRQIYKAGVDGKWHWVRMDPTQHGHKKNDGFPRHGPFKTNKEAKADARDARKEDRW